MNKQQNRNDAIKKVAIILSVLALFVGSCGQATTKQKQTETTNENILVCQKDSLVQENILIQEEMTVQENVFTPDDSLYFQIEQFEQFLSTNVLRHQDLDLYRLLDLEVNTNLKFGFASLSDNYPLSEHPDSLAIPNLCDMKEEDMKYFKLSSKYRKRFLSKTKILETDTVFVYDYSSNIFLSFPVKNLNIVAYLNVYSSPDDCPCSQGESRCDQYDYMIGFEISKNFLKGLGYFYSDVLVYVGKENPFVQGQMKPIVWNKINSDDFPVAKANFQTNATKNNTYLYESNEFRYFVQDYVRDRDIRHLLVVDIKNDKVVAERIYGIRELSMPAPLNFGINNENYVEFISQWTGKLFKNKPPVVFGFEWVGFGCESITLLDSTEGDIWINCDNRH